MQQYHFVLDVSRAARPETPSAVACLRSDCVLPTLPGNDFERQAFQSYLVRCAPVLAGSFDDKLWCQLIPRLSHSEPAVWNAVVAISQFFVGPGESQELLNPFNPNGIKYYSKAIANVKTSLSHHYGDPSMALLTCVLFFCLETQQGSISNAMSLLEQSFMMLAETIDDGLQGPAQSQSEIWNVMLPFFSRHTFLAATFGQPVPKAVCNSIPAFGALLSGLPDVHTIIDARTVLYTLMFHSHSAIRLVDLNKANHLRPPRDVLLKRLQEWKAAIAKVEEPKVVKLSKVHSYQKAMLLMYWHVTFIWMSVFLDKTQTAFDNYIPEFEEIIHQATIYMHFRVMDKVDDTMSLIPPLYFVATKCREPSRRRKAVDMLKQALLLQPPCKSRLWRVVPTARIAETVIKIEEQSLRCHSASEEEDHAILPAEPERIHNIELIQVHGSGRESKWRLKVLRFAMSSGDTKRPYEQLFSLWGYDGNREEAI